MAQYTQKMHSR